MSKFTSSRQACPVCGVEIEIPMNATMRYPKRGAYLNVSSDMSLMRAHVKTHAEESSHE